MKPYFERDGVTIYHGDCRRWMPDADVIVTDPPYDIAPPLTDPTVFASAAVFGYPELLVSWCVQWGVTPDEWIVWWPTNAMLKGRAVPGVPREAEHIALFGEARPVHGAPLTPNGVSLLKRGIPTGEHSRGRAHADPLGKRWGDVWVDAAPGLAFQSKHRLHPNEKPLTVMRRLVQMVSDGLILDPFMGSGTTLRAAMDLGRRAIGIEIEEKYCEIAARRLEQQVMVFPESRPAEPMPDQPSMFEEAVS